MASLSATSWLGLRAIAVAGFWAGQANRADSLCWLGLLEVFGMARILVVDDEPHVTRIIGSWLEQNGHRVVRADNGQAALGLRGMLVFFATRSTQ